MPESAKTRLPGAVIDVAPEGTVWLATTSASEKLLTTQVVAAVVWPTLVKASTLTRWMVPTSWLPVPALLTENVTGAGGPPGTRPPLGGVIVALIVSAELVPT